MRRIQQNNASFDMFECDTTGEATSWAQAFVRAQAPLVESPAVVFDIDDTLVFSRTDAPNQHVVQLYNQIPDGVERTVVTARPTEAEEFSKQQLHELVGGAPPVRLYHMPEEYLRARKVECYKRSCRREIEQNNRIVLNIGDQWSDVFGTRRVLSNAMDLEDSGELSTTKAYVILAKNQNGRDYLAAEAGVKLPG